MFYISRLTISRHKIAVYDEREHTCCHIQTKNIQLPANGNKLIEKLTTNYPIFNEEKAMNTNYSRRQHSLKQVNMQWRK